MEEIEDLSLRDVVITLKLFKLLALLTRRPTVSLHHGYLQIVDCYWAG